MAELAARQSQSQQLILTQQPVQELEDRTPIIMPDFDRIILCIYFGLTFVYKVVSQDQLDFCSVLVLICVVSVPSMDAGNVFWDPVQPVELQDVEFSAVSGMWFW